jgi:hypothetical protein
MLPDGTEELTYEKAHVRLILDKDGKIRGFVEWNENHNSARKMKIINGKRFFERDAGAPNRAESIPGPETPLQDIPQNVKDASREDFLKAMEDRPKADAPKEGGPKKDFLDWMDNPQKEGPKINPEQAAPRFDASLGRSEMAGVAGVVGTAAFAERRRRATKKDEFMAHFMEKHDFELKSLAKIWEEMGEIILESGDKTKDRKAERAYRHMQNQYNSILSSVFNEIRKNLVEGSSKLKSFEDLKGLDAKEFFEDKKNKNETIVKAYSNFKKKFNVEPVKGEDLATWSRRLAKEIIRNGAASFRKAA